MKKCPLCAEEIQDLAIKCKHCGGMLNQDNSAEKIHESSGCLTGIVSFFIPGVGQFVQGKSAAGILFLAGAIVFGCFTYGIGWFMAGIVSACSCSDIYKCSKCRDSVDYQSSVCKHCGAQFKNRIETSNNALHLTIVRRILASATSRRAFELWEKIKKKGEK